MVWEKVKLGDVCTKIGSGATPKGGSTVYVAKGVSFIRSQNVYNLYFDYDGLVYINDEAAKKLSGVTIKNNDVLLNITGDSVARTCLVPSELIPARVNQHVAIVRPDCNILNPIFLNYYLASPFMQAFMLGLAVGKGASRNAMTKEMIANFEIPCPPINIQKRIIDILKPYDDLIENNQKQIKLLEEAAQRLYKEWFVDFRFPGYENTEFVDGLPKGWKYSTVESFLKTITHKTKIRTSNYLVSGIIPVIDQSRDFVAGYTNDIDSCIDIDLPIIVFGDHTRVIKYIQFPFAQGADGTQLIISNNKNMPQPLFYCSLVNVDLSNYHYARHFKYLKAEKILLPTMGVANKFETITNKIFKEIQNNRDKIKLLIEARDRLLPKLMSGEILI